MKSTPIGQEKKIVDSKRLNYEVYIELLILMGRGNHYPRDMSDWIQYLISQKSHVFTLIAGLITYISITTLLLVWYIDKQDFTGSVAAFVLGIVGGYTMIYLALPNSTLYRAKVLLRKIMDGKITNPEEVKDMWNNGDKKRMSKLRLVSYFSMALGGGFIFFAVGAMTIQFSNWIMNTQLGNAGMVLFMLGIALLALDFSIGSDKRLTKLGKDSNEKMTTIANATFIELVDVFEDKRIQLLQHPEWLGIEGTIWKCETYVDRALALHSAAVIEKDSRHRLFRWFYKLIYQTGLPWDDKGISYKANVYKEGKIVNEDVVDKLKQKDVDNISKIIRQFREFDLDPDDLEDLDEIEKKVDDFKKKNF